MHMLFFKLNNERMRNKLGQASVLEMSICSTKASFRTECFKLYATQVSHNQDDLF